MPQSALQILQHDILKLELPLTFDVDLVKSQVFSSLTAAYLNGKVLLFVFTRAYYTWRLYRRTEGGSTRPAVREKLQWTPSQNKKL